mgnify:CR=1 FL=1
MTPNLNDMLVFLAVVDERSFSAAAEQLNRTRSAVSQAVSRLESDVGARLLYRSTRSLALTEAGARLASRCRDIKRNYDDAIGDLQDVSEISSGLITVTAPHALCGSILIPTVAQFIATHANLSVRIIAEDARLDLIDAQVDLALRSGQPSGQTARITKIGGVGESLYASKSYVDECGGIPSDLEKLRDWDHIANEWQGTPISYELNLGTNLTIKPRIRCNAFPHVMTAVYASLGVARLPDPAAKDGVRAGQLLRIAELGVSPIYAVHQFDKRPPKWVKSFVQALRNQMQGT